jgi:uncharacterized membrane protein
MNVDAVHYGSGSSHREYVKRARAVRHVVSKVNGERERTQHYDELQQGHDHLGRSDDVKEGIQMLLSHHPPSMYGHCLRLTFRGRSLYFCARCTGMYGGLAIGIVALLLLPITLEPSWLWFLVALAIGFSTVIDWMSQRLTPRKTTNFVRATTGFMSGLSLAIIFLLGDLFYMLIALAVMSASIGLTSMIEGRRRATLYSAAVTEASNDS